MQILSRIYASEKICQILKFCYVKKFQISGEKSEDLWRILNPSLHTKFCMLRVKSQWWKNILLRIRRQYWCLNSAIIFQKWQQLLKAKHLPGYLCSIARLIWRTRLTKFPSLDQRKIILAKFAEVYETTKTLKPSIDILIRFYKAIHNIMKVFQHIELPDMNRDFRRRFRYLV